jgi:hypothetical protein
VIIRGPSYQLAALAALCGWGGYAAFSGTVNFEDPITPTIGPVGLGVGKAEVCLRAGKPLIMYPEDADIDQLLQLATDSKASVLVEGQIIAGLSMNRLGVYLVTSASGCALASMKAIKVTANVPILGENELELVKLKRQDPEQFRRKIQENHAKAAQKKGIAVVPIAFKTEKLRDDAAYPAARAKALDLRAEVREDKDIRTRDVGKRVLKSLNAIDSTDLSTPGARSNYVTMVEAVEKSYRTRKQQATKQKPGKPKPTAKRVRPVLSKKGFSGGAIDYDEKDRTGPQKPLSKAEGKKEVKFIEEIDTDPLGTEYQQELSGSEAEDDDDEGYGEDEYGEPGGSGFEVTDFV